MKYNYLTIVKKTEIKDREGVRLWAAVCDCGNGYFGLLAKIKSGHVKTCGFCAFRNVNFAAAQAKREYPLTLSALNKLILNYKHGAKRRQISYNLSRELFIDLTSSNCFYCGGEPAQTLSYGRTVYTYNGIDRFDPKEGYVPANVVACCKECNWMKLDMKYTSFFEKITKISQNLQDVGPTPDIGEWIK